MLTPPGSGVTLSAYCSHDDPATLRQLGSKENMTTTAGHPEREPAPAEPPEGPLPSRFSIGTVGNALDNALMESTIGLYKTELIKRLGPWRTLTDVELATAEWTDWYNNRRLHGAP